MASGGAYGKYQLEYLRDEVGRRHEAGMPAKDAAYDIALSEDFFKKEYSGWDSPERIMTNTQVIYRHLQGRTEHLKPVERANILRKQALLAYLMKMSSPS